MNKSLTLAFLLAAGFAFGQFTPVPPSSYPALDAVINGKLQHSEQAGPASGSCTPGKQVSTNTTNGDMYWCTGTNVWTLMAPAGTGGGGGAVSSVTGNASKSIIVAPTTGATVVDVTAPVPEQTLTHVHCVGDSLTAGDPAAGVLSYCSQLANAAGINTYMSAITGYTSTQILNLYNGAVSQHNKLNIILAGRNNYTQTSTIMADVATIVASVRAAGGRVLVMSPPTANGATAEYLGGSDYHYFTDLEDAIVTAYPNESLRLWTLTWQAGAPGGASPDAVTYARHTPPQAWVSAGVHLTTTAYAYWTSLIYGWMKTSGGQYLINSSSLGRYAYQAGWTGRAYVASGTGDAIQITPVPPPPQGSAYATPNDGLTFCYTPSVANTGAATLALNTGGPGTGLNYPVVKAGGALVANDIITAAKACIVFHVLTATTGQWELLNPQTVPTGGGGGGLSVTTKGDLQGFSTVAARLPVGTDGQVVTADASQALGLKWATPPGGGVSVTTKGDLQGFSTVAARLPVGADGQVVTADASTALGLKWATPAAGGGGAAFKPLVWPFGLVNANNQYLGPALAHQVKYIQINVPSPGWILGHISAFTAAAGPNIAFALYDSTCSLLAGSTTATHPTNAAAVDFIPTGAPLTVAAGLYYLALTTDTGANAQLIYAAGPSSIYAGWGAILGETASTYPIFQGSNLSTGTTSLAFPATCGTRAVQDDLQIPAVVIH